MRGRVRVRERARAPVRRCSGRKLPITSTKFAFAFLATTFSGGTNRKSEDNNGQLGGTRLHFFDAVALSSQVARVRDWTNFSTLRDDHGIERPEKKGRC